jgi:hypothetical protein
MSWNRGIIALQECEGRLRQLVVEAASDGDYDVVLRLTEAAQVVSGLAAGKVAVLRDDNTDVENNVVPIRPLKKSVVHRSRSVHKVVRNGRTRSRSKRAAYPRFARVNDQLVKIGWSKKDKREYQHKAPRGVVDSLVSRLLSVATGDDLFNTERLFPILGEDARSEIPSYQSYLCLAWLRDQNLIEQVGRQGYRLTDRARLQNTVDRLWKDLPSSYPA